MPIPSRMAAAGVRARCFALGVRSEAVSGQPAGGARLRLMETYTLADYSWCEGSGVARAARWPRRVFRPGDGRARTADPLLAKQVLSQLSYIPVLAGDGRDPLGPSAARRGRGPFWIRTRDLTVISRALSPTELKAPAGCAPRGARGTGLRLSPGGSVPPGGRVP
jgi:hypothetical protein